MARVVLIIITLCTLAACATSSLTPRPEIPSDAVLEQYNAQVPEDQQIVCFMVTPLGSRFARRECYRRGDLEAAGKIGQDVVDLMAIDGLVTNPLGF